MNSIERASCANEFLSVILTSKERMLVASLALGFNQNEIARAFGISTAAVSQMFGRIRVKAARFWQQN